MSYLLSLFTRNYVSENYPQFLKWVNWDEMWLWRLFNFSVPNSWAISQLLDSFHNLSLSHFPTRTYTHTLSLSLSLPLTRTQSHKHGTMSFVRSTLLRMYFSWTLTTIPKSTKIWKLSQTGNRVFDGKMTTKMTLPMTFFVIHFLNVDDNDIQTSSN